MSRSNRGQSASWVSIAFMALIPIAIVGLIVAFMSISTVPAGHVGVEKGWAGDTTGNELEPGTHFVNPLHSVQNVECRPRTYTMAHQTKEGEVKRNDAIVVQSVNGTTHNVDVTIRYHVDCSEGGPTAFVDRWKDVEKLEKDLIRPDARSDIRDEGSDIPSLVIYKKKGRERLADTAEGTVHGNFEDEPVGLDAVKIRDVTIPDDMASHLEDKEEAKIAIETKQNEVEVERKEAQRKEIEAKADAEVIRIKGEALKDNEIVLQQEYIDALRNGETIYVVPNDGGTPIMLQADKGGNSTAAPESPSGPGE